MSAAVLEALRAELADLDDPRITVEVWDRPPSTLGACEACQMVDPLCLGDTEVIWGPARETRPKSTHINRTHVRGFLPWVLPECGDPDRWRDPILVRVDVRESSQPSIGTSTARGVLLLVLAVVVAMAAIVAAHSGETVGPDVDPAGWPVPTVATVPAPTPPAGAGEGTDRG